GGEGDIELRHQLFRLLGEIVTQPKRLRHPPSMMRHDPGRGIDGEGHDLFGPRAGDLLDLHPARSRNHEGDARTLAVDKRREIELAVDGGTFFDIEAADLGVRGAGLGGDEHPAAAARGLPAPGLPRPAPRHACPPRPAWICARTRTTGAPRSPAALTACSTEKAACPRGTGTPNSRSTALA